MIDFDEDAAMRKAGWESFTKVSTYATVAVVIVLSFLAIFWL